jgi:hypothetical protein
MRNYLLTSVKFGNEFVDKNNRCIRTAYSLKFENNWLVLMLYKTYWISQVMCNGKVSLNFFICFSSSILFSGGLKNVEKRKNSMAKLCFRLEVWSITNAGNIWGVTFFRQSAITVVAMQVHEICQSRVSKVNIMHKDYVLGCDVK